MIKYEFKGTPGPWGYEIEHGCVTQIYACKFIEHGYVYPEICKFDIYKIYRGDQSQSEEFANARLIAAAPDMFKLLKKAHSAFSICDFKLIDGISLHDECAKLLDWITSNGS